MNELTSQQLLGRLIGFATVSRDSNLEMIAFIRCANISISIAFDALFKAMGKAILR